MITLKNSGSYLLNGQRLVDSEDERAMQAAFPDRSPSPNVLREETLAYRIMRSHSAYDTSGRFRLKFDSLASHDITYVAIIQTARASGLTRFPVPYVMTNCHNSLCAAGGTINEDDHVFGLSAAKKYGGIFVPPNQAVLHSYIRETMAGSFKMILGSDSHTRYGALGCMGIGEGGPELVKQLLSNTYDIDPPEVVLVWLEGTPPSNVGPHDIALELVRATFPNGFVKNKILEFAGPGLYGLSVDFRNGIDVMTTETSCLSSIWATDDKVRDYYAIHGREDDYKQVNPSKTAYYDSVIRIDLSRAKPMIALPFHPSNAYPIASFLENAADILRETEKDAKSQFPDLDLDLTSKVTRKGVLVDQGIIGGCAGGTFESIVRAASILRSKSTGNGYFSLSVYPGSMPIQLALTKNGTLATILEAGGIVKPAFCGPCFGAGDIPSNNGLSIRHTTRNFPNREGSVPSDGQLAGVALMDAMSIAATAVNGGYLTPASYVSEVDLTYRYDPSIYEKRVYNGFTAAPSAWDEDGTTELRLGPNIADWPKMYPLNTNLLVRLASVIRDPVTTTDELIPSGETSSYRSNPIKLASYALSRRDPGYRGRAMDTLALEEARRDGRKPDELVSVLGKIAENPRKLLDTTSVGSCIFANKPGDGSAREQAAAVQKVLGGTANICYEYATKRYRSNCINWGIIPFTVDEDEKFAYDTDCWIYIPNIRQAITNGDADIPATVIADTSSTAMPITLHIDSLTQEEREILLEGCLINHYAVAGV